MWGVVLLSVCAVFAYVADEEGSANGKEVRGHFSSPAEYRAAQNNAYWDGAIPFVVAAGACGIAGLVILLSGALPNSGRERANPPKGSS